jgi:hypothetical protein
VEVSALRGLLRERVFRRVWLSYSASAAATGMMPTALMLAVLDRPHGFTVLGLVLGARTLGNAVTTLSLRIWLVAGPTAAVALYTQVGRGFSLTVSAALWLVSALLAVAVASKHRATPARVTRTNVFHEFGEGLGEARRHRWFLAGLTALVCWLALGEAAKYVMLPVVSRQRFDSTTLIGLALGAYSAGAIAGAVLMSRCRPRRVGIPAMIMLGGYGLVPISLAYASQSWMIIVACAIGGMGIEVFNIPWFTAIQREVPTRLQARISSLDFLASYGMSPLGFAFIPIMVNVAGAQTVLTVAGLLVIGSALATLLVPGMTEFSDPRDKEENQDPVGTSG